ncbi:MAG: hypothetical protein K8J31_23405, partial [Anaerolineae bacterium]|nr:hypothetical protein [Anaerolineae bacterium]
MLVILYSLSQSILLGSFLRLEAQSAADNVERVVNALKDETTALSLITTDWAYWDETYHFVQTQDEDYIVNDLNEPALTNLNLSFIVFVDAARNVVYSKVLESGTGEVVPDDTALQEPWIGSNEFFRMIDLEGDVNGYIQTAHGPALVAARSILTSVKEGPTAGTLIMGRYLNDYRIQTVSQSLRMMIELHSAAESEAHEGFVAVAAGPSE